MKTIDLNDLKEVCNAFTLLIQSNNFKSLPGRYPYTQEIVELRQGLKQICHNADENEALRFRLMPQNKKKLISTRWELANYVNKINFDDLNFKE